MRVLITGCNGLLGQKLIKQAPNNVKILGVDLHSEPFLTSEQFSFENLDITKRPKVIELVRRFEPEWIVNTAALTDVDACEVEKEKCWRLNVEAVGHLVRAAAKIGARVLQLSSDYVFDGKKGPYSEEENPNPICYYGKSKLASENILRMADSKHVIARTAVLYGNGIRVRPNFVTWLLTKLGEKQPLSIVDDQISNTTLANELADCIWRIVALGSSGTFHLTGREIVSRFDFAQKIAKVFDLDGSLIQRAKTNDLEQKANRPLLSGLVVDKALQELGVELSDVQGGLLKLRKEMDAYG